MSEPHPWDSVDEHARVIDLAEMTDDGRVFFVVEGVFTNKYYRQQMGGQVCNHRVIEGDAQLLEGISDNDIPHVGCSGPLTPDDIAELTPLLERLGMTYDDSQENTEAWVHVRRGYMRGVLTWQNCD